MPFLPRTPRPSPRYKLKRKTSSSKKDKQFLDSKAWKSLRQLQLSEYPYCEACMASGKANGLVFGAHIDHIVRRSDGGAPLGLDNLQTLCRAHHDRKNGLEKNHGALCESVGQPGERVPAPGGKEKVIKLLIGHEHINNR